MIRRTVMLVFAFAFCSVASGQDAGELSVPTAHAGKALGALTSDLVYTPIAPCRIIDTRLTAAGVIAAGTTRSFIGINGTSYTSQGGSATDCGTRPLVASGLMLHVTAATPALAGFATVYASNTPQPATSNLQYSAGAIVSSAVLAQIPNPPLLFQFTIFSSASAHYIVDIVGYFAPPVATALECIEGARISINITPGSILTTSAVACPAAYTSVSMNCDTEVTEMVLLGVTNVSCTARNNGVTTRNLTTSRTCCRVPGR